jgi:hypothetical protein
LETKNTVSMLHKIQRIINFFLNLIRTTEDMRIILLETTNTR